MSNDELDIYPCVMDDESGEITKKVGPVMKSWSAAVDFLKQNYSGAWAAGRATPQRFKGDQLVK